MTRTTSIALLSLLACGPPSLGACVSKGDTSAAPGRSEGASLCEQSCNLAIDTGCVVDSDCVEVCEAAREDLPECRDRLERALTCELDAPAVACDRDGVLVAGGCVDDWENWLGCAAPSGEQCALEESSGCVLCCAENPADQGFFVWFEYLADCACEGSCGSDVCADYCQQRRDSALTEECQFCFSEQRDCGEMATAACDADPDCRGYLECVGECP